MITLFRKIRKQLISEKKVSRYLGYALGEILLVVIGILIALSINNWNEERKNVKKVDKYLEEIKLNLSADIDRIDTIVSFNQQKIAKLNRIVKFYYLWSEYPPYEDSLIAMANEGYTGAFLLFEPSKTGLDALLGSGELNLISDSIRIKLNHYYTSSTNEKEVNERVKDISRGTIQEKLRNLLISRNRIIDNLGIDLKKTRPNPRTIETDDVFASEIMFLGFLENERIITLSKQKQNALDIIQLIDSR